MILAYQGKERPDDQDEFDTTVTGPWIGRWDIVNHNKHTEAFKKVTASATG